MDGGPDDAALLAAVGQRDLDAMRTLYDRHAPWLAVRLSRRCNDQDLVADAVQDTFVAVWQKPQGFRGDGDVAAWLWGIAIAMVSFAPLMSTVWWKQYNLIALALGVAGFDRVRRSAGRFGLGPALIGLSVAFKPLLILLPFVLVARRETRRAGLLAIGWLVGLSMAGLALAAWRAHQFSVLNPWSAVRNFSDKSNPHLYGYIYSPDNFAPVGTMIRLGGVSDYRLYEVAVVVFVGLLGVWTAGALRGRGGTSWDTFAFVSAFSVMVSPIDWGHYQVMLAPLLVVLAVRMSREGASAGDWLGLALAFVLASLVWRPDGTLTGTVRSLLAHGRLPPDDPGSGAAVPMEALGQCAQYVLIVTGLLWYARPSSSRTGSLTGRARGAEDRGA